jgi:hypothetical protein
MNIRQAMMVIVGAVFVSSCAASAGSVTEEPLFPDYDMARCRQYIDAIIYPSLAEIRAASTLEELRVALVRRNNPLSNLVRQMRVNTLELPEVSAVDPAARTLLAPHISSAIEGMPEFATSGCGPDVKEYLLEELDDAIGGGGLPHRA